MDKDELPPIQTIVAADQVRIGLRRYQTATEPRGALIIAPGMGVSQGFYGAFAHWLAVQGYAVYTFDYRGTGASRPAGSLRGYRADILDWARLDCQAVIAHVSAEWPEVPICWLGHSLGAQIVGLAPNHGRLRAVLSVAAGSGYYRFNAAPLRFYVPVLWHAVAPVALNVAGYFPGRRLGMVGDLPAGVMSQWRKWCLSREYLGSEGAELRAELARVQLPITAWSMRDDEMITWTGTKAFFDLYPRAPVNLVRIDPEQHGVRSIGHFGFFRTAGKDRLWPLAAAWLERTLPPPAAERCA